MTIMNVDDLLIKLAKTTTHTYDVYPTSENSLVLASHVI